MTWREWKAAWRWWNVVAVALLTMAPLLVFVLLTFHDESLFWEDSDDPWLNQLRSVLNFVALLAAASPVIWIFVVTPWLESADTRFNERMPPARRLRLVLVLAWTPALVTGGIVFVLLGDAIFWWWRNSRWDPEGLSSIWMWLMIALALTWGWQFGRLLCRRLIRSQQRARVCFSCAYSLAETPNCQRCPECGQAVREAGTGS